MVLSLCMWMGASWAGLSPREGAPDWQWFDAEGDGAWGDVWLGDADGDRRLDLFVHDPVVDRNDRTLDEPGRVLVFRAGPMSFPTEPTWVIGLEGSDGWTPTRGVWGDINGDGAVDQVAWLGNPDNGTRVFGVRWGSTEGPSTTIEPFTIEDEADDDWYRQSLPVGPIEDIDGDGFGDLILLSREYAGMGGMMHVQIHAGSATGFAAAPTWELETVSRLENRVYGTWGGDVFVTEDSDFDGHREVVFTTYAVDDDDGLWRASLTMYRGDPDTILRQSFWTSQFLHDIPLGDRSGVSVVPVGDLALTGIPDTLVTVDGGTAGRWTTLLFKGSPDYGWTLDSPVTFAEGDTSELPVRVLGAGDFDGDGLQDAALGTPGVTADPAEGSGVATLYLSGDGLFREGTEREVIGHTGDVALGTFGDLYDVNADGKDDLVVTTAGDLDAGLAASVQVFFGYLDHDEDGYDDDVDDCDPLRADVNPGADDVWYDGVDQDCDGADDYDQDADGFDWLEDCDDVDAAVFPGAEEVWYDGTDQDCDGADDYDQDGDGYPSDAFGGTDCDDTRPSVKPGAEEITENGLDDDCVDGDRPLVVKLEEGDCGCDQGAPGRGSAAMLGLLALAGLRRRQ